MKPKTISELQQELGSKVPGILPIVELAGNSRVLIEHHKGILEYGRERIVIKMAYGSICIQGKRLEISEINGVKVVIFGRIDCLSLQNAGRIQV